MYLPKLSRATSGQGQCQLHPVPHPCSSLHIPCCHLPCGTGTRHQDGPCGAQPQTGAGQERGQKGAVRPRWLSWWQVLWHSFSVCGMPDLRGWGPDPSSLLSIKSS